jgi:hypothetical protein
LGAASALLSTDFFSAILAGAGAAFAADFSGFDWAAARPGLSTDLEETGFAAVTGLFVDFVSAAWGNAATDLAGTSRVSVFKLA